MANKSKNDEEDKPKGSISDKKSEADEKTSNEKIQWDVISVDEITNDEENKTGTWQSIKKLIKKHKIIFTFITIVLAVVLIVFFLIKSLKHFWCNNKMFRAFFVSDGNKFNWIGITSIVTVITLGFNAWDRRRQFKADLISKSRISWLRDLKEIISIYSSTYRSRVEFAVNLLITERNLRIVIEESDRKLLRENESKICEEYNRAVGEASKQAALLRINLYRKNDDCDESKLLKRAYDAEAVFGKINILTGKGIDKIEKSDISEINELRKISIKKISNFENLAAEYCKNEWERAKQGK